MLFTAEGLEQATRLPVAARHADRFAAAGVERVVDLGCGIGVDAMAAGRAGPRGGRRRARPGDRRGGHGQPAALPAGTPGRRPRRDFPDRRPAPGRRRRRGLGDPARRTRHGAPAARPRAVVPSAVVGARPARHRLSARRGQGRPGIRHDLVAGRTPEDRSGSRSTATSWRPVLWFGLLARRAGVAPLGDGAAHRARGGGRGVRASTAPDAGLGPAPVGAVGGYLHEPDGAVIRAGLVGARGRAGAAAGCSTRMIAYVTTDEPRHEPARPLLPGARRAAVGAQAAALVPARARRRRADGQEARAARSSPDQLRRQLRLDGHARRPPWC